MTTHLSARLAWHENAWDARVCASPHLNTSCIMLQHIREARDDERERRSAGMPFDQLRDWLPPCSRDAGAYAAHGFVETHGDPLDFRALPPVKEEVPPYSCCPSPYRWMREENLQAVCLAEGLTLRQPDKPKERGWVFEPDRQRTLLHYFWQKLEPKKSLIFYYCNQGNPLDEDAARLIVGVGRIKEIGSQFYFGTKPGYPDQYPVWSRRVTQDFPEQGVRIPYQEYLQVGHPVEGMTCRVPASAMLPFSYVGEHVSDDVAVAILERIIQSVEQVRQDGLVPGDWDGRLSWLNDVLAEVWSGRGAFPGLGSVLQALGCEQGTAYQRDILVPLARAGKNPWEHVLAVLTGHAQPEREQFRRGLTQARERWQVLPSARRALLAELARFELTEEQVRRIADPTSRAQSGFARDGIVFSESALIANPYCIAESDLGTRTSERVALETIDHGMRAEGDAALFPRTEPVTQDDRRRVRGVARAVLEEAATSGDTILPFIDLLDRVRARFPERRACQPDQDVVVAEAAFYREILWLALDQDPPLAGLQRLRTLEEATASMIRRRAAKVNAPTERVDWHAMLEGLFGAPATERARSALDEKTAALDTLLARRLAVLRGGAGTGKTSVLRVFLSELERLDGRDPILLLAPTGKARVRLATQTKRQAMTIHQFLLRSGWLAPETFTLRQSSEQDTYKAGTVIVDECSMIPADVFGTLLRALDTNTVRRLILVGDPNQLPPIGPGRPFIDITDWLSKEHPECIATLRICMRVDEVEGKPEEESVALSLAEGYRADVSTPGDDEILSAVARGQARGDLDVVFWHTHDDLLRKLRERMSTHLQLTSGDFDGFNRSLGIPEKEWARSEAWQILSPMRTQPFGTDELNRIIQREFRKGLIAKARNPWNKTTPRPFGDQDIVWTDKVIQLANQKRTAWPKKPGTLDYVANGEIGIVCRTSKGANGAGDTLDVAFSTQPDITYRYWSGEINDNLELAYALTVHKAQGSDFDTVFFIVPQEASTLSRELIYTALTRFRRRLVLLIERDTAPLLALRSPASSDTQRRNTYMFTLALRPEGVARPHLEALIHRTRRGVAVRSKSEVVVADILDSLGISYEYEKPLYAKADPRDFRLPDFTVSFEGDVYYWEHLGMLSLPSYREAWERKRQWYQVNGYAERLVTSEDGLDGSIDASQIERTARIRILEEEA